MIEAKQERTCSKCGGSKDAQFCNACNADTPSNLSVLAEETINVRDTLRIRKFTEGIKKFVGEFLGGWFPSGDPRLPEGVHQSRSIDKEKDEYHEVVKKYGTDEIIHENHEPLSRHIHKKTYPIIGMSIGNSYFKDETVEWLLKTVVEKFGVAVVLIPDVPAISTYIALGYPENRARRDKAIPKGNALRNLTIRNTEKLGYPKNVVKIIDWQKDVENNPIYQQKYKEICSLYESNGDFKESVNQTTKTVLEASKEKVENMDEAIKIAVHYLLSELAFHEFAVPFLGAGKVVAIYHHNWQVYEDYITGKFDGVKKDYLGFLLLK